VGKFLTGVEYVTQCEPVVKEKDVVFPNEMYSRFALFGFGSVMAVFKSGIGY